ncbi:methyl-accepting chemotaxis protein [soil metagenome]
MVSHFFFGKTIHRRLISILSASLLISFIGSAIGYWALSRAAQQTEQMYQNNLVTERVATDWYRNIANGVNRAQAVAASTDDAVAKFFAPISAAATAQSNELREALEKRLKTPGERALFNKVTEARKKFLEVRTSVMDAKKAGDQTKASELTETHFQTATNEFLESVKAIVQLQRTSLDEAASDVATANAAARWSLVVFSLIALLIGGLLTAWLSRSITMPLQEAIHFAGAIAQFDLSQTIRVRSQDETGQLLQSLEIMQTSLLKLIGDVRESADNINTASAEIAAGNLDLSQRTEQTAISLQQAATSMTNLTDTVQHTADSAVSANHLASSASQVAQRGRKVVSEVVRTMEDISESSRRIKDIIATIDGIAFQTNILALNAAVEAARAGEQGRGFAVVAAEVRSLAQRSAAAAKEIKELIDTSAERVDTGTRLVQDAGATMKEIVFSVKTVSDIIGEIASATREQSEGLRQVNSTVAVLDEMTQQNSALVEQSAAAAASLSEQAEKLSSAIEVFRLSETSNAIQVARAISPVKAQQPVNALKRLTR